MTYYPVRFFKRYTLAEIHAAFRSARKKKKKGKHIQQLLNWSSQEYHYFLYLLSQKNSDYRTSDTFINLSENAAQAIFTDYKEKFDLTPLNLKQTTLKKLHEIMYKADSKYKAAIRTGHCVQTVENFLKRFGLSIKLLRTEDQNYFLDKFGVDYAETKLSDLLNRNNTSLVTQSAEAFLETTQTTQTQTNTNEFPIDYDELDYPPQNLSDDLLECFRDLPDLFLEQPGVVADDWLTNNKMLLCTSFETGKDLATDNDRNILNVDAKEAENFSDFTSDLLSRADARSSALEDITLANIHELFRNTRQNHGNILKVVKEKLGWNKQKYGFFLSALGFNAKKFCDLSTTDAEVLFGDAYYRRFEFKPKLKLDEMTIKEIHQVALGKKSDDQVALQLKTTVTGLKTKLIKVDVRLESLRDCNQQEDIINKFGQQYNSKIGSIKLEREGISLHKIYDYIQSSDTALKVIDICKHFKIIPETLTQRLKKYQTSIPELTNMDFDTLALKLDAHWDEEWIIKSQKRNRSSTDEEAISMPMHLPWSKLGAAEENKILEKKQKCFDQPFNFFKPAEGVLADNQNQMDSECVANEGMNLKVIKY